MLISKLYRQMYANTGIATDSARHERANRMARLLAKPCRRLFVSSPEPGARSHNAHRHTRRKLSCMRRTLTVGWLAVLSCVLSGQSPPQKPGLTPAVPKESTLRVRLERVGRIPTTTNPTSPAVAGSQLLLIDQGGALYRWDGSAATPLITIKTVPAGVKPIAPEPLMNVAADKSGSKVYVMFLSATMPRDLPRRMSPRAG